MILGGEAANTPLKDLQIDGTLRAHEPVDLNKHLKGQFVVFEPTNEGDSETLRIRGFKPAST